MIKGKVTIGIIAFWVVLSTACQREINDFPPVVTISDSIGVIKTSRAASYDNNNSFLGLDLEVFDYSKAPQQVTVNWTDSSVYGLSGFAETFQYDNNNRLLHFASTEGITPQQIDYQYNANGNLAMATLGYPGGNTIVNTFSYQTINGNTIITQYDTANVNPYGSLRPRILTYTFDAAGRLVKQLEAQTNYPGIHQYWYEDTSLVSIVYNNAGSDSNASVVTVYQSYFNGGVLVSGMDSIRYIHEAAGPELYNSYRRLYRNLYWLSLAEIDRPGESLVSAPAYCDYLFYWQTPVKQVQRWSTNSYFPDFAVGQFQNIFNAAGQLTHAFYPPGFANDYGGKTLFDYTYVNVKK